MENTLLYEIWNDERNAKATVHGINEDDDLFLIGFYTLDVRTPFKVSIFRGSFAHAKFRANQIRTLL